MVAPLVAAVAPKALGGIFSIFGANKARRQAKQDAANKFVDLRDAAIRGGFNPLTALMATGGGGFGAAPSSAPPLASVELLTGAIGDVMDEATGAAAQRRAIDRLNFDLASLKLDQARSGVVAYSPVSAARSVGGAAPVLGRSAKPLRQLPLMAVRRLVLIQILSSAIGQLTLCLRLILRALS